MPWRDPMVRMRYVPDHAKEAVSLAEGKTRKDIDSDRAFYLALTRLLEIIGEAANRVSKEEQDQYPSIPWIKSIGMRNFISHGYDTIEPDVIWDTLQKDIPPLVAELEKILREERTP